MLVSFVAKHLFIKSGAKNFGSKLKLFLGFDIESISEQEFVKPNIKMCSVSGLTHAMIGANEVMVCSHSALIK